MIRSLAAPRSRSVAAAEAEALSLARQQRGHQLAAWALQCWQRLQRKYEGEPAILTRLAKEDWR